MPTAQSPNEAHDATLSDGDIVEDFGRFHAHLQSRLTDLQEWMEEAHDSYEMEVEYTPYDDGSDRVSVVIDSDDCLFNKGEIGDSQFHIILGERGGVKTAHRRRTLAGKTDYLSQYPNISRAWRTLGRHIRSVE